MNMRNLDKEEVKNLMIECEARIKEIDLEDQKNKKKALLDRPFKRKIKDLVKYDPIYLFESYTGDVGYRIIKCYVSSIKMGNNSMEISIFNDEHNFGIPGMYVRGVFLDKNYFYRNSINDSFFTLSLKDLNKSLVELLDILIQEEEERALNKKNALTKKFTVIFQDEAKINKIIKDLEL